ncbi:MAG: D-alanyl-D-alanine carboxypeptidase/D-alanyl-D-alanine-endopeptidase [Deltaproteobacteria bacterium CG_4_10_14_0_2_um_filter_43_8]|nr:MAG: D-alanyl-D-alanine carboxypeptidase/D-alanyl-D-alanine-endopeptidase [Deltaproteobacteria bacterium CG11_big_fil_rev_8_21_14_0_20_42_23]PJA21670.1 MAG: D-alanyl-D-alanine carboxypeptidase/D-alanyl-D-alanine-endopeptidase [Deltaproteobacteria bacterium CG_4_10_14_0_2_um_filter_43_8]PJC64302.1 MAG: D-alanyl-D-alanine carboxypeptidase/D-alanyl-D-alanine-endopeptidase [Deltaproteobacteria bacterium CG_4_9_14_0_2_um_filter_42_21]
MSRSSFFFVFLFLTFTFPTFFSSLASAENIQQALEREIKNPAFSPQQTALVVAKAETGEKIAAIHADELLSPASTAKIVTTVATLSLLGPQYTLPTYFYADQAPRQGKIKNLYIKGTGDPFIVNEQLWRMVHNLAIAGVESIEGDIIIDNSFFDAYDYPSSGQNSMRAYGAQTAAFSTNFNSIALHLFPTQNNAPARVIMDPPIQTIKLINRVKTGKKYTIHFDSMVANGIETITISGSLPASMKRKTIYRSVANPLAAAGGTLLYFLDQHGIEHREHIQIRNEKVPASASLILKEESKSLSLLLRDMNKFSNNFVAEQLTKHLGAVKYGFPGSTEKGIRAMHSFFTAKNIPLDGMQVENGSGLSNKTRLTARQLVSMLEIAYQDFSLRSDLMQSLSVFGVDGTLKHWGGNEAHPLYGQLKAKTGTLSGTSALAGFVPLKNGEVAVFALIANGFRKSISHVHDAQLSIAEKIMNSSFSLSTASEEIK